MTLHADIEVERGEFTLSVGFDVPRGTVLAVLGPNGSGKSTVLNSLAGLLLPDRGVITFGDRTLTRTPKVHVPAHDRAVGLLAQEALLFPHLSVVDNVAFAPRAAGKSTASARAVARRWLSEVDAEEFEARKPSQLSGGQAQRVAVARALAGEPDLLLLDEPFAALDVDAAPAVRGLLRRVLRAEDNRRATVLVTHDPLDALALADHVIVLSGGRIVEQGPTRQVLSAPRTPFTARIAGLNLVEGIAKPEGLLTRSGGSISGVAAPDAVTGEPAVAVFAPAAVSVYPAGSAAAGSPRNTVAAVVGALEPYGAVVRLRAVGGQDWADGLSADLTPAAVAELALEPGTAVRLSVKAASVTIHPVLGQ
ncbi:molybdenum ABC transporter ATP-binding protein [Prauserella marina]|uniref:Molybdate transport system ATP-binding protein n=1 Tax=Prauserella marina TaxID=530584 RepID=A0A222VWY7_9PSEU|nr:ATP-binding cassette domain-containing protein [Prauserella marina]ASR38213.1 molybdenum ABC transporter ATP-binding protein [Prauserella marina]PWV78600.1 molybdate transport system ATP-binding protein [Prauserella marina]SDC89689.1 molybdate transport system ATP-binding protein [Prauserella marina]